MCARYEQIRYRDADSAEDLEIAALILDREFAEKRPNR
jgi:hypothetical protein